MNKMTQRKSVILLSCIALLCCIGGAQAQQNSVSVSPVSIDAKVKRGASYTQTFTLTNNTGTRLRFKCSVSDVWYDEGNKRVTGRPGTLPHSASLWVQFSPAEIDVEPGSSASVKAIVTVPQTAAGGYYSVPIFEALPVDPVLASATIAKVSTAKASIGVRFKGLMMFTTLNASEYNVEIMGGHISPPSASAELAMQLDVRNRGNAHARLHGSYAILNSSGALVGRGAIKETRYLPDQRKMLEAGWAGELSPGKYTAVITVSYDRVGMEPATLLYELPLIVQ
ncbi:MAG TPA: hypothetical protein DC047_02760 [Blastocatellia bacterium]|nr:hypothetical protein [Blastocatellia bacterium]